MIQVVLCIIFLNFLKLNKGSVMHYGPYGFALDQFRFLFYFIDKKELMLGQQSQH
jgi:hypothetical protein